MGNIIAEIPQEESFVVTLATLPQATAQQVFNHVVKHLLVDQRCVSRIANTCLYRKFRGKGAAPLMCAAGCLMTDEEYERINKTSEVEYRSWDILIERGLVPKDHSDLISRLQTIHDAANSETYRYSPNNKPILKLWSVRLLELIHTTENSLNLDPSYLMGCIEKLKKDKLWVD